MWINASKFTDVRFPAFTSHRWIFCLLHLRKLDVWLISRGPNAGLLINVYASRKVSASFLHTKLLYTNYLFTYVSHWGHMSSGGDAVQNCIFGFKPKLVCVPICWWTSMNIKTTICSRERDDKLLKGDLMVFNCFRFLKTPIKPDQALLVETYLYLKLGVIVLLLYGGALR